MAESAIAPPTLSEQYHLEKEPKPDIEIKSPTTAASEEVVSPKTEENVGSPESGELAPAASEESIETSDAAAVESNEAGETASAADEESSENTEQQTAGDEEVEQTPEIKLETAPADYRFPTTNQSRHCFTRYIEYHRCIAAKGESAPECDKFAKYYRSLCPGEWIDRWNEQRENGTFPGPL